MVTVGKKAIDSIMTIDNANVLSQSHQSTDHTLIQYLITYLYLFSSVSIKKKSPSMIMLVQL